MPETEHSQKNISEMLTRMGNVEAMLRFSVGSSSDSKRRIEEAFKERERSAEIYLLFEQGPLTQSQVEEKSRCSKATVSRVCAHLVRSGLLAKDQNPTGSGYVWRWSELEDVLNVSKLARTSAKTSNGIRGKSTTKTEPNG